MARSEARMHIFSLIFQLPFHDNLELNQAFNGYKEAFAEFSEIDKEFIYMEFKGTSQNIEEIDAYISKYLKNWTIERLETEVLAILRMAVYEMIYAKDIPNVVTINESVELSKTFTDEKGRKFINGVLGNISKELSKS